MKMPTDSFNTVIKILIELYGWLKPIRYIEFANKIALAFTYLSGLR